MSLCDYIGRALGKAGRSVRSWVMSNPERKGGDEKVRWKYSRLLEGSPKLWGDPGATADHQRALQSTRDRSASGIHIAQSQCWEQPKEAQPCHKCSHRC